MTSRGNNRKRYSIAIPGVLDLILQELESMGSDPSLSAEHSCESSGGLGGPV